MNAASQHPLFAHCPIAGSVTLDECNQPTPYHVYEGHGTLITGTADAGVLTRAFADQDVFAVLNSSGEGQVGLFVCRFDNASHGPHLELHLTALAAPKPGQRIADTPEAFLAAFATRPDWGVLSLHLWNDTPQVVAYNRDYLGLNASAAGGEVAVEDGRMRFAFRTPDGDPLVEGDIGVARRTGLRQAAAFIRLMGVANILRAARQPHARAFVINPKGPVLTDNRRALTLTAPDRMIVTRFAPGNDRLSLYGPTLECYGFSPRCVEHLVPFRFVYLHPDAPDPDAPAIRNP